MNLLFFLSFWLAAAPDPWQGRLGSKVFWVIEPCGDDITLEEFAQVIAAAAEPQLGSAPVDGMLQFWWTAERERNVCAAGIFFNGHKIGTQ